MRVQNEKAQALLALHHGGQFLILPNVWSPLGARVLESRGQPAIATASAAISALLGYEDGERIRRSTLLDVVGRIASSVEVPVTADIEGGYAETPAELQGMIQEVLHCGVVGINLEDGLGSEAALRTIDDQCAKKSVEVETL